MSRVARSWTSTMSTFEYYWVLFGLPVIAAVIAYYLSHGGFSDWLIRIKAIALLILSIAMALFMWTAEAMSWLGLLPQ
jgi:heme/copper-type cytochrome/quinol oxidase subunit 4